MNKSYANNICNNKVRSSDGCETLAEGLSLLAAWAQQRIRIRTGLSRKLAFGLTRYATGAFGQSDHGLPRGVKLSSRPYERKVWNQERHLSVHSAQLNTSEIVYRNMKNFNKIHKQQWNYQIRRLFYSKTKFYESANNKIIKKEPWTNSASDLLEWSPWSW